MKLIIILLQVMIITEQNYDSYQGPTFIKKPKEAHDRRFLNPENIPIIPRAVSWNSKEEVGFIGLEFRRLKNI